MANPNHAKENVKPAQEKEQALHAEKSKVHKVSLNKIWSYIKARATGYASNYRLPITLPIVAPMRTSSG